MGDAMGDATRWVGIGRRRTLLTRTRGTAATYGALGAAGGFLVAPFVWYPALKRQAGKSPGILACSMLSAASTGVFGACFGACFGASFGACFGLGQKHAQKYG